MTVYEWALTCSHSETTDITKPCTHCFPTWTSPLQILIYKFKTIRVKKINKILKHSSYILYWGKWIRSPSKASWAWYPELIQGNAHLLLRRAEESHVQEKCDWVWSNELVRGLSGHKSQQGSLTTEGWEGRKQKIHIWPEPQLCSNHWEPRKGKASWLRERLSFIGHGDYWSAPTGATGWVMEGWPWGLYRIPALSFSSTVPCSAFSNYTRPFCHKVSSLEAADWRLISLKSRAKWDVFLF